MKDQKPFSHNQAIHGGVRFKSVRWFEKSQRIYSMSMHETVYLSCLACPCEVMLTGNCRKYRNMRLFNFGNHLVLGAVFLDSPSEVHLPYIIPCEPNPDPNQVLKSQYLLLSADITLSCISINIIINFLSECQTLTV